MGGIHRAERSSKSQPAKQCGFTPAKPSRMFSTRRRVRLARSLLRQRDRQCGSKAAATVAADRRLEKLNGTSSDPPLGPPVPNWLPRQLPPLAVMDGRTCRVEPIDSTRHGKALYAAYATDREGRLWTYLPWGPYSGPEELCARID